MRTIQSEHTEVVMPQAKSVGMINMQSKTRMLARAGLYRFIREWVELCCCAKLEDKIPMRKNGTLAGSQK